MCSQSRGEGYHRAPGSPVPHLPWLLVQLVFQSPSPAATDIPSRESVELGDQLSGVIHFLVLTELCLRSQTACLHKGRIQMLGARAPRSPVSVLVSYCRAQLEYITLHPGRGSLPKHASAALLLLKGTGTEVIFPP